MIKILDASVADPAVLGAQRSQTATRVAQSCQHSLPLLPFVKVRDLSDGRVIAVRVERDVARIPSVSDAPAQPHQYVPVDEAIVRPANQVPCDWNALQAFFK